MNGIGQQGVEIVVGDDGRIVAIQNNLHAAVVTSVQPVQAHGQRVALPGIGSHAREGPGRAYQLLAALDNVDGAFITCGE